MNNVIYVDVLILINMFVTYFLVLSTSKLLGVKVLRLRNILVTLLGGVYALIIFVNLNFIELSIIKLVMGVSLVFCAYGFKNIRIFIKSLLTFFVVNFVYGGLIFAVWMFITPSFMQFKNGIVYFNISAITLATTTVFAYGIISLFCYILNRRSSQSLFYQVEISCDGKNILLNGFLDTGNKLVDIFTGLPIIVCEFEQIKQIIPQSMWGFFEKPEDFDFINKTHTKWNKKVRIIPVNSVAGCATLPAFKPDCFEISINKLKQKKEVIIAVSSKKISDSGCQAILTNALL